MSEPDPETIKLTTDMDQYSVVPGGSLEITLVLTNQGQAPDPVRVMVEGIPLAWVSTGQPLVLLQPGEVRTMPLTIQPPAPPNAHAGRYSLRLSAASTLNPTQCTETMVTLKVAGYEIKGRLGILLDTLRYSVMPGEQLSIPVVLINNGLVGDTIRLAMVGLPQDWVVLPAQDVHLEPGQEISTMLVLQPPRDPSSRAGRYLFCIQVTSQQAPDPRTYIDCTLTVAAFIQYTSTLEAASPDGQLSQRVRVTNLSNVPATFMVSWESPWVSLNFEPAGLQKFNVPVGGTSELPYSVQPVSRLWIGEKKSRPYSVSVQANDQQTQTLQGAFIQNAVLPVWGVLAAGFGLLLVGYLCLTLVAFLGVGKIGPPTATALPAVTGTLPVLLPSTTHPQNDQIALLVGRKWYLVSYNDARSNPGVQEAYTLFNPDSTLIGYTGCKDLSGVFQTSLNQITISNVNLSSGTCVDPALQPQEDAMLATLRSARSYYVADTALQIASDNGFLNYSLTPVNRPEAILPPQAVIKSMPQAQAGQVIVFDGSTSTGQVPLVAWLWDFGDGASASGVIVQHGYLNPGAYTVKLTVTDQRVQTGTNS